MNFIAYKSILTGTFGTFFITMTLAQAPGGVAANYPAKPIKLLVPFTPGGSTDILACAIGVELTKAWGQPVVIENLAGAGGSIGADKVAKSSADGYTLLMGHIGTLAVNPSVKANNVKELVALAKSKPGQLNYGSGAIATPNTPEVFGQLIVREIARWKPVI